MRSILRRYPSANLQRMLDISETMARRSQEIIDEKKAALARGDEDALQRVGEGKDIMSVLRESFSSHNPTAHDLMYQQ